MDPHYTVDVELAAPIEKVYGAISTAEGIRNWWTADLDLEEKVGGKGTFRFGKTYNSMEVRELNTPHTIKWKCIEQHHDSETMNETNEWVGTSVHFGLTEDDDGTTLLHVGLVPEMECYKICESGWGFFLKTSLKAYVETGTGKAIQKS